MKIATPVLEVITRCSTDGTLLFLPPTQLERKLYEAVNKVLVAAGGKWNRGKKAHVFDRDAADAMEQIVLTGEITIPQDFDYYPTPPTVVARMLELAEVGWGMSCLEPSAGRGAIALPLAKECGEFLKVHCVEYLDANIKALKLEFPNVVQADFLEISPETLYDRVVMNPPFSKQADIKHVTHALKFLKPGGVLVSVMSASITFRTDTRTAVFNELLERHGGIVEPLPEGSFRESGTMVNTVLVRMGVVR